MNVQARFNAHWSKTVGGYKHTTDKHTFMQTLDSELDLYYSFVISGDLMGKFTLTSDRYAVLASSGKLDVDILFHRQLE